MKKLLNYTNKRVKLEEMYVLGENHRYYENKIFYSLAEIVKINKQL